MQLIIHHIESEIIKEKKKVMSKQTHIQLTLDAHSSSSN